jgi:hypothetical protein
MASAALATTDRGMKLALPKPVLPRKGRPAALEASPSRPAQRLRGC